LQTSFTYDEAGAGVLDPDVQVRETIAHFFETFSRVGSARRSRCFARRGLCFLSRSCNQKPTNSAGDFDRDPNTEQSALCRRARWSASYNEVKVAAALEDVVRGA
jgi:hypothetical protein